MNNSMNYSEDIRTRRIAEYLKDNEAVADNDSYIIDAYRLGIKANNPDFVPVEFLDDSDMCMLDDKDGNSPSPLEIMYIFENSKKTFHLGDTWFYYDSDNKILHSSKTPYADGMIDAMEIAQFCVEHDDDLCDDEIRSILDEEV